MPPLSRHIGVTPPRASRLRSRDFLVCLFGLFFCQGVHAQERSTVTQDFKPLESRLISDSEIAEYLATLIPILPMTTRERDPFGSVQDPDAVPKVPVIAMPEMPDMPAMTTPFEDVVRLINVSTVMPGDRRFLIGDRQFGVGDVITINFRGQPLRAKVEEVSSRRIRFLNMESGAVADRTLELLPAGMSSGGSRPSIPGLIPTGPNVPIDME